MCIAKRLVIGLIMASLLYASGCNKADPAAAVVEERNKTNIQKVANAYVLFAAMNRNAGPESEEELNDFIANEELIERNLKMMKIEREDFQSYFVSSIDNEPFKVRWGLNISPDGTAVPLVFETTGVDGTRRVGLSDSRILEVQNEGKYKSLLSGKINKEDAGSAPWEQSEEDESGGE